MKKGFTILELLVASLLLGMLMTILTMIFSQSSIAWRVGTGTLVDLDKTRSAVAKVRIDADNAYLWEGAGDGGYLGILSVWRENGGSGAGKLRSRTISTLDASSTQYEKISSLNVSVRDEPGKAGSTSSDWSVSLSGSASGGSSAGAKNYTVNVQSWGPDGKEMTYDDIRSSPDDFDL